MATKKPPHRPLGKVAGSASEARRRFAQDKRQREAAGRSANSIILDPRDVAGGYDAGRVLQTTLNGERRVLTAEDLAQFRRNMAEARRAHGDFGGITARQVIDLASSGPLAYRGEKYGGQSDIDKARSEIKAALPVGVIQRSTGLDVRFVTSAGADSDVARHHVVVQFRAWRDAMTQLVAAGVDDKAAPRRIANWLRKQKLAFDCDCGRARFFFRFVATIGGFNAGRDETGFPKIRNPGLKGVACKHVLRVMAELESSGVVLGFLEKALARGLADSERRLQFTEKQKDVDAAAKKQRGVAIKTSEERRSQTDAARRAKLLKAAAARAAAEHPIKKLAPGSRRANSLMSRDQELAVQIAAKQFGMSEDEVMKRLFGG